MTAHLDPDNLPAGGMVDSWRVVRRLGGGAYGTTYLVEKGGASCAMKVARHREQSGDERHTDERTQRELSCLLSLRHRHIARVWAHGRWPHPTEGYLYIIMDYVEGYTLSRWQEHVRPTAHEVAVVIEKVLLAVAHMHGLGILHRDLKPENMLVGKDGGPVIVDYGAAHFPLAPQLTTRGLPPGTPRYTSPEALRFQAEHRHDRRARYEYTVADELYALGVTLYDVLTDPWPCTRPDPQVVSHLHAPPDEAHVVNERVPVALSFFTAKLLAREPDQRPESAERARRDISEFIPLEAEEWVKRPLHPLHPLVEPAPGVAAGAPPAPREPPRPKLARRPWSRAVRAALGVGVVLLVVGVSLALRGMAPKPTSVPAPVAAPSMSSVATPEPAAAPPPSSPPALSQEKGPNVKAQPSPPAAVSALCSRKKAPPQGGPEWRAWCKCAGIMGTLLALQASCTGPQVRPFSAPCPQEARDAMVELEIEEHGPRFKYFADMSDAESENKDRPFPVIKEGPITSAVWQDEGKVKEGSLVFGEARRISKTETLLRYTLVQLPDGRKYPVCF